jgi:transcriptional regulator with XRE-family HTH domain
MTTADRRTRVDDTVDPDAFLHKLGKRVRFLRLAQELTQDELAEAAGMSRSFLSIIEHGTHGIDVIRLLKLAAALDITLTELLAPDR